MHYEVLSPITITCRMLFVAIVSWEASEPGIYEKHNPLKSLTHQGFPSRFLEGFYS